MVVLRRSVTFEVGLKVPTWDIRHGALLSPKYSEPDAEREPKNDQSGGPDGTDGPDGSDVLSHAMRSRGEPGTGYRLCTPLYGVKMGEMRSPSWRFSSLRELMSMLRRG